MLGDIEAELMLLICHQALLITMICVIKCNNLKEEPIMKKNNEVLELYKEEIAFFMQKQL